MRASSALGQTRVWLSSPKPSLKRSDTDLKRARLLLTSSPKVLQNRPKEGSEAVALIKRRTLTHKMPITAHRKVTRVSPSFTVKVQLIKKWQQQTKSFRKVWQWMRLRSKRAVLTLESLMVCSLLKIKPAARMRPQDQVTEA